MVLSLLRTVWAALSGLLPWCGVFALGVVCGVTVLALCTAAGQAEDAAGKALSRKLHPDCAAK